MKKIEDVSSISAWDYDTWFKAHVTYFDTRLTHGKQYIRSEKSVGRLRDGRMVMQHFIHNSATSGLDVTVEWYEIDGADFISLLDSAKDSGRIDDAEYRKYLDTCGEQYAEPWDTSADVTVCTDTEYTLGQRDGKPYITCGGKTYILSSQPYEPCLYVTPEGGALTTVHNAFDPFFALEAFASGSTIVSVTGRIYTARDFCRMAVYAAQNFVNTDISEAEKVFCNPRKQ